MMKKNKFSLFLLGSIMLLCGYTSWAQQPQWYIKNYTASASKKIDFRTGSPSLSTPSSVNPYWGSTPFNFYNWKEADNAIYDNNGNLQIFIAHNEVFDASGNSLFYLVKSSGSSFQDNTPDPGYLFDYDLAICRLPEDCDRFLIFRYSYDNASAGRNTLDYYIFNSATGLFESGAGVSYPIGSWVRATHLWRSPNPIGNAREKFTRGLSISKLNNDGKRFLFYEEEDGIRKATISNSGVVDNGPFYDLNPYIISGLGSRVMETEIIQLPSGDYIYTTAVYTSSSSSKGLFLHIDNSGTLTSVNTYSTSGLVKGLEFSKNGDYLYLTKTRSPYLQYIDMTNPTSLLTLSPSSSILNRKHYKVSSIEIAHNGKMYFAGESGISSLANSNDPTSAWVNLEIPFQVNELQRDGFPEPAPTSLIPLPNQVDGELLYTPINTTSITGCGASIPAACVEYYSGFTYEWFKGTTFVGSGTCFTPTDYGTYILYVTDENKCRRSYPILFKNNLPYVEPIADVEFCSIDEGAPLHVGWDSNPMSGYSGFYGISWTYNGSALSYGGAYQIPYQGTGTYTAKVTTACGSQTFTFNVTDILIEGSAPGITISACGPITGSFTGITLSTLASGYDEYIWHITNTTTGGISLPIVNTSPVPVNIGYACGSGDMLKVTLELVSKSNCKIDRRMIFWSDVTGPIYPPNNNNKKQKTTTNSFHQKVNDNLEMTVFPNPTVENSTLILNDFEATEEYILQLFSVNGTTILQQKLTQAKTILDLSSLQEGIYFVKVINRDKSSTRKLIKK